MIVADEIERFVVEECNGSSVEVREKVRRKLWRIASAAAGTYLAPPPEPAPPAPEGRQESLFVEEPQQ